jgi:hypothetical protein
MHQKMKVQENLSTGEMWVVDCNGFVILSVLRSAIPKQLQELMHELLCKEWKKQRMSRGKQSIIKEGKTVRCG